jgi:pyruvate formate lyase activating enzyme
MHRAMLWEKMREEEGKVHCFLCRHHCHIKEGRRGLCRVRENRSGELFTLVYDRVIARHVDPVEKKPLYHFFPGSRIYSLATPGCNFRCRHCQNADIAQLPREPGVIPGESLPPMEIVAEARKADCRSIAYTYTEPTVFFELALDTAKLAAEGGIDNVFVTNGYITPEALAEIGPYLQAANIDLKGFSKDFYRRVCGASLDGVLDSIRLHCSLGIWIELTTLLIPDHNDSESELRDMARFIAEINPNIPWHLSRFFPAYRLTNLEATAVKTLRRAREIGLEEGLRYVYLGNMPDGEGGNTHCLSCGDIVIGRAVRGIWSLNIEGGACGTCGRAVPGVGL